MLRDLGLNGALCTGFEQQDYQPSQGGLDRPRTKS
jgi:hypothetical protein